MTDKLTALDATFLELEQVDDCAHMHIGGVMIFEPLPAADARPRGGPRALSSAWAALPRYRQRLSAAPHGRPDLAGWVEDPAFDIAAHVRHATLPAPGGEAELLEWAGGLLLAPPRPRRPLWEMVLLDGLDDGRWALASKTHHCLVDGVGSVDVGYLLLDASREPRRAAASAPGAADRHGARTAPGSCAAPAARAHGRAGAEAACTPRARARRRRARALAELLLRDEVAGRARTRRSTSRSAGAPLRRRRAPLDDLKAIKRALGGTVNDVVLAVVDRRPARACSGRGEEPPERGPAGDGAGEHARAPSTALGNQITSLFVHLPVAEGRRSSLRQGARGHRAR